MLPDLLRNSPDQEMAQVVRELLRRVDALERDLAAFKKSSSAGSSSTVGRKKKRGAVATPEEGF